MMTSASPGREEKLYPKRSKADPTRWESATFIWRHIHLATFRPNMIFHVRYYIRDKEIIDITVVYFQNSRELRDALAISQFIQGQLRVF
jgi:hypothetical protein